MLMPSTLNSSVCISLFAATETNKIYIVILRGPNRIAKLIFRMSTQKQCCWFRPLCTTLL